MKKQAVSIILLPLLLFFVYLYLVPGVAAQSTGDTLPTNTPSPTVAATPLPVVETNTPTPTLSPTPVILIWEGRLVTETVGIGVPFSRLLIRVEKYTNHPVKLSTLADVINTANTGQKPVELGADVVEFTGLTPSTYFIEPLGLNVRLRVELKSNTETWVEFRPIPPPPTATYTPLPTYTSLPPTVTPTPTNSDTPTVTPTPTNSPTPTITPFPTSTATPLPSPTPVTGWLGTISRQPDTETSVTVKVSDVEGVPVRLRLAGGGVSDRRCITGQDGEEMDSCVFRDLLAGQYVVSPEGLGISLPLPLFTNEQAEVIFDMQIFPPGITGWRVRIESNSNGFTAIPQKESVIIVRVEGKAGQVVALRSARGTERYCEAVRNPVLGGLACEFGQLGVGVYRVELLNTGVGQRIFVDGAGTAIISFSPDATYALVKLSAIVGYGVSPDVVPVVTVTPTIAATKQPHPTATPTISPTATITPTPTPAFAWQSRILEVKDGVAGTIAVRAAGLKDHPVILKSGGWQSSPLLTGTKPEWGKYAVEFAGLAQGEYIVELVGLAELKVKLGADQFMLVEFRYDFVK